ncbi:MAG: flotillin family protein, partial [Actinomycetota bacterium]|nr:flotillin family protein [Actinomycetota bacterium]
VLNGAQGMSEILNQIIAQAGSSMQLAQQLLSNTKSAANGVADGSAKLAEGTARRPVAKR